MFLVFLIAWHLIGVFSLLMAVETSKSWISRCWGWEFVNPYWVYKYCTSVNWFGAFMLSLFLTLVCPAGAICYWFYKLCTVGRK